MLGTRLRDFEPQRNAELPLRQFALQRLAQVLHFLFVDPQVGVARDAELRERDDLAPGEEVGQMRVHHRRQQQELVVGFADLARQLDHARHEPRRLDDRDRRLAAERVVARQLDDEVERLVDDLRERMRRVEPDRRQQRAHLAQEEIGDPRALGGRAVGAAEEAHAVRRRAPERSRRSSSAYWSSTSARAAPLTSASSVRSAASVMPAGGIFARSCSFRPATRISKNSSRLLPTMVRKRSRSSSGTPASAASASTRRLNAISDSSRLIGDGSGAVGGFGRPRCQDCGAGIRRGRRDRIAPA